MDRIREPKRKDDDDYVVEERGQKFLRRIREVTNRNKRSNYSKRRLIFVVMKGKEAQDVELEVEKQTRNHGKEERVCDV